MRAFILLCLVVYASAQYTIFRTNDNSQAISLPVGNGNGPLRLAPVNPLDKAQQWSYVTGVYGVFVASRLNPNKVFDIAKQVYVVNTPINAWDKKVTQADTKNQRFYNNNPDRLVCMANSNKVGMNTSGHVVLVDASAPSAFTTTEPPAEYPITLVNNCPEVISITLTNAAASEPTKTFDIPANSQVSKAFIAGITLEGRYKGSVLYPTPYTVNTVNQNDVVVFNPPTQAPTPAPTQAPTAAPTTPPGPKTTCTQVVNPIDGKVWSLNQIPELEQYDNAWYQYNINFCGTEKLNEDCSMGPGTSSPACQDTYRSLGIASSVKYEFPAAGQIKISIDGGYVDWGCSTPRSSEFILTCEDVSTSTVKISGGCGYTFEMKVPLKYCNK